MTTNESKPRRGRPPKLDGEQRETRDALLHTGMRLLTEQGFQSTGIDAVLREVGVPKGSFYHYFPSKEAFGRAVLERYADYFNQKLDRCLLNETRAPLERLCDFVAEACEGMAKHDYRRGCLVGNLGQEVTVLPDGFREHLEAILCGWTARLAACLRAAQHAGQLAAQVDCDEMAAFFWIGWEGAVLRARLMRCDTPLQAFARGFLALLPH